MQKAPPKSLRATHGHGSLLWSMDMMASHEAQNWSTKAEETRERGVVALSFNAGTAARSSGKSLSGRIEFHDIGSNLVRVLFGACELVWD